ncbi:MAG: alpha/beta fold hydrolase [Pseudomonadota bacterium]
MTRPTLVLVHGFMGGSAQWAAVEPALSEAFKLIAVDLPGFGARCDEAPLTQIGAYADWVAAHLTQAGVTRYHLLGHSMGGMIAQEIARRDASRIARLVLYATGPTGVLPGRFEPIATSKARAEAEGAEATARRIAATWFLAKEAAPGYPACADIAAVSRLPAIRAGLDAMAAWDGVHALAQITQPTLILWGDQDRTYDWHQIELLWTRIPQTRLAVVPDCAHAVHAEAPDLFAAHLKRYLL